MKNLFTFIVALFMATSVYAQKTVTYSFTDGTVGTSSDGLPSLTFSDGAVLKLSAAKVGNSDKKFYYSDNITVDGVEKQTIKLSKGLQTILELPKPATKITLYSFYNDNAVATKALYWKEFAGQIYNEETATKMQCNRAGHKTNPDAISFDVNYLKRVTFTDNGYKQICVVIKVEYADESKYSSVTIGEAGFATHASKFAVDYSNRTDGLEAYAVKYANGTLTYNKIDGVVPANTAVLLKGEAKEYILAAAGGAATTVDTDLKPSDGNKLGGNNIYCLANKTTNGVGFYRVSSDVTIPANKAYLEINTPNSAKYYSIGIGGNTTGIQAIQQNGVKADGIMYSLSGQRVGANYKGIVICNGKKMIKK